MQALRVIAITHKDTDLSSIGNYHVQDDRVSEFLPGFQERIGASELLYLSTCNRVEFALITDEERRFDEKELRSFFQAFFDNDEARVEEGVREAQVYEGEEAIRHLFRVASSLDSMVIGEREIISQVRKAFERCNEAGTTGDLLRLVIDGTVKTAKEIYTRTRIATRPVSVVSLAYQKLRDLNIQPDGEVLVVGAGKTNRSFCKFLKKHGYSNFKIHNRSPERGKALADELEGEAASLEALKDLPQAPSILLTSTASEEPVVDEQLFRHWKEAGNAPCVIIDLAMPGDVAEEAVSMHQGPYIGLGELRDKAEENMKVREKEMDQCHAIIEERIESFHQAYKEREVELAMRQVPQKVKEINERTINNVFAQDIEKLDPESREVLDRVVKHLEKKYMSVPMKMAREILLEESGAGKRSER